MTREYGSTKEFTTYNGSSISNTMWSSPPKWGDLPQWTLGTESIPNFSSGRRTWNLNFSYMSDSDMFGENQSVGTYGGSGEDFEDTILTGNNFFSIVWHKTLGGNLPMIFQPDKDNFNLDQFAIVKIKGDSLNFTQSAVNIYDINLILEEVW
jgi:hypothetical protein